MEKLTSKDSTSIAFDKYGSGPAVILVGGAFQHRAIDQNMAQLAAILAPYFTVFHYDRRGRGDSNNTHPYAVEREIEDIEALINEAGGSAFVFGMSSGGVLALDAAIHGLAIKKLALYEPPFNIDKKPELNNYPQQLNALLSKGRSDDAVTLAMKTFGTPAQAIAGIRQTPIWSIFKSVAPTLAYDAKIMGNGSIPTEQTSSIKIPVLVIDGGASPEWLHRATQALTDSIPNAISKTLKDQTHDVAPKVLAHVLQEFFMD